MSAFSINRKQRSLYLLTALFLFVLEVLIERYVHDAFVRPYLGDFLVVILVYAVLMSISYLKVVAAAVGALLFAYAIETAQYVQLISLLSLDQYKWARVVMGTSFSWWDMLMYTLGILCVLVVEHLLALKK
ncbi:MAG: hypothetical protein ACI9LF_001087 [Flavobacteriales bacterium]|jgi:hypothetical protein